MTTLFLLAFVFGEGQSIRFESKEAPTGLRITKVVLHEYKKGTRSRVDIRGRYSGYDDGKVWFDFTLKNTGRVIGTFRTYVTLIRNEKFSKTFYVDLNREPQNTRAFFKFGEVRVR